MALHITEQLYVVLGKCIRIVSMVDEKEEETILHLPLFQVLNKSSLCQL